MEGSNHNYSFGQEGCECILHPEFFAVSPQIKLNGCGVAVHHTNRYLQDIVTVWNCPCLGLVRFCQVSFVLPSLGMAKAGHFTYSISFPFCVFFSFTNFRILSFSTIGVKILQVTCRLAVTIYMYRRSVKAAQGSTSSTKCKKMRLCGRTFGKRQ